MLFEINFTTCSDFLETFKLFFRNLTSLNLLLTRLFLERVLNSSSRGGLFTQ